MTNAGGALLEGCTFGITPTGEISSSSACQQIRGGSYINVPVSGKASLVGESQSSWVCLYEIKYSTPQGDSWTYDVNLNSTRNNISGSAFSNVGLPASVTGTRLYPPTQTAGGDAVVQSYETPAILEEQLGVAVDNQKKTFESYLNTR